MRGLNLSLFASCVSVAAFEQTIPTPAAIDAAVVRGNKNSCGYEW
jgi:hypothetical protein